MSVPLFLLSFSKHFILSLFNLEKPKIDFLIRLYLILIMQLQQRKLLLSDTNILLCVLRPYRLIILVGMPMLIAPISHMPIIGGEVLVLQGLNEIIIHSQEHLYINAVIYMFYHILTDLYSNFEKWNMKQTRNNLSSSMKKGSGRGPAPAFLIIIWHLLASLYDHLGTA
ncbi:hypothetical protein ACJX0J_021763 [Zea mays]